MFTNENWLSKTKGPKRTKICELAAVVDEEEMVERTTYIIQVQTSDIKGGSQQLHMGTKLHMGKTPAPTRHPLVLPLIFNLPYPPLFQARAPMPTCSRVFGDYGDTGTLALKEGGSRYKFEQKSKDVFHFPDILILGE